MQIKQPEGLTKGNFKSTNCQNRNGKGNHIKTTGFHSRFFPNVWHPGAFPSSSSRHGPRVSHRARRGVLRIQHGSASAAASPPSWLRQLIRRPSRIFFQNLRVDVISKRSQSNSWMEWFGEDYQFRGLLLRFLLRRGSDMSQVQVKRVVTSVVSGKCL